MINHGSRSTWGPGPSGSRLQAEKCVSLPNKNTGVCYILSVIMFSPKHMAAEPPNPILGHITPGFVSGLSLGS